MLPFSLSSEQEAAWRLALAGAAAMGKPWKDRTSDALSLSRSQRTDVMQLPVGVTTTGPNGEFRFAELPEGKFLLAIYRPSREAREKSQALTK